MALNVVGKIDDAVPVRNVLVSVWDKTGLGTFIPAVAEACPGVAFYSTGGTFARLGEILGPQGKLVSIADYTGQPQMQGGLVKTLDFKIYLGLLSETYNEDHRTDLARVGGVVFDMVVVNLYPFRDAASAPDATIEAARGHIDIGGPCMLRAAAKNFLRVAPVVDPADYDHVARTLSQKGGTLDFAARYQLAAKAFSITAAYDAEIAQYLAGLDAGLAAKAYAFPG
jgi:phosphoribosylaminoimidazolecarboxamide formyltransferase/IMP cyclohydrolase